MISNREVQWDCVIRVEAEPERTPEFLATGALLDAAEEFVLLSVEILQIVVGELSPLLFEFALDEVPVAFDFEFVHRTAP
jgi:hypothetical protein